MARDIAGERRTIAHIDMDAFFVSVEEALNPKLKGKPVIVGGDPDGRGVVASASYKAREYGVRSAMPLAKAKRLCPKGIFIRGSHHVYAEFSRRIMEILADFTPAVSPVSVDEAYLDFTGCLRVHKADPVTIAQRIHDRILNEAGVPSSIGIASNRMTAKIAANMAKPNGILYVRPGCEARFLAPLPIGMIPGVGPASEKVYREMGIRLIGDLARFSPGALEAVLGRRAETLAARAKGAPDKEAPAPGEAARSIGREITYAVDTSDPAALEATLSYLSESVARRLRKAGMSFGRVTLKLRYEDFNTYTRSRMVDPPATDARTVYRVARELMRALYNRRARVRLVGVTVSALAEPCRQTDMFGDAAAMARERLEYGMDRARDRFGFESVLMARSCLHSHGRAATGGKPGRDAARPAPVRSSSRLS